MKSIAIIGASKDKSKFGNKAVRAYLKAGYGVYPINPHEKEIEGQTCYSSITDLPEKPDKVSIYLPKKKQCSLFLI